MSMNHVLCFHNRSFCLFCHVGSGVEHTADHRGARRVSFPRLQRVRHCVACSRKLLVRDGDHCAKCVAHSWQALRLFEVAA